VDSCGAVGGGGGERESIKFAGNIIEWLGI